jgi:hypothetical protein
MTRNDRAHAIVKALEERVYAECMAKGRLDILDAIREGGYQLRDDGDLHFSFWVGQERVMQVRLNVPLRAELLN